MKRASCRVPCEAYLGASKEMSQLHRDRGNTTEGSTRKFQELLGVPNCLVSNKHLKRKFG